MLDKDPATVCKWIWTITFSLQGLKATKTKFPTGNESHLIVIVSVDGTDCRIKEPQPFDQKWFSQKFKGMAVKCKVALDVLPGRCTWINGPFMGGKSKMMIFQEESLMDLIPEEKLAVANKGLRSEPGKASFSNHLDKEKVAELKRWMRAHQKTFFACMKSFKVLSERFHHKLVMEKHKACFETVAVLVQCSIDNGFPHFLHLKADGSCFHDSFCKC